MLKRIFSWMLIIGMAGTMIVIGNAANAREGMMKGEMPHGEMGWQGTGGKHSGGMGQYGMMGGKHHAGYESFLKMKDKLGLSGEQVARLKALKSETKKQTIRIKADLEILQIELYDLLHQDEVDVKAVDAKVEERGELKTEMYKVSIHAKLEAQNILTPEQLKEYRKIKEKRRYEMHKLEKPAAPEFFK
ncbi:MAG: Spy/CpxP family protein refolding chaperone [Thermodesulfobacteriota bacterium]